jgi:Tol biopolymer transport system component
LVAQPFDAVRLALSGVPVTVAEDVYSSAPTTAFSASNTGVIAFRIASAATDESRLQWFDRHGQLLGQIGPPGRYGVIRLSIDGKALGVDMLDKQSPARHIWTVDVRRDTFTLLNPGSDGDAGQVLSPDGRIAYTASSGDIYIKAINGAAAPQVLVKSSTTKHSNDWSRDGRYIVYDDHNPTAKQDLYVVPVNGDRKPVALVATSADETEGAFSPDGRWVAYSSDESGRRDVYVRDFDSTQNPPTGKTKVLISTAGGLKPRWDPKGNELYYSALDGTMMSVSVNATPTMFDPGVPQPLFKTRTTGFFPYDVAPDGRFLVNTVSDSAAAQSIIRVILNWSEELKARVPTR